MKRTKSTRGTLTRNQQIVSEMMSRTQLSQQMGFSFGDKRRLYKALGYPEEGDLTFEYFFNKYDRQDIANAIINRPCDATWKGEIILIEEGKTVPESELNTAWRILDHQFGIKKRLNKVDKLCELGRFSIILLGLDDVKNAEQFKLDVNGKRKLLYVKQIAESEVEIETWEDKPSSPRYGLPLLYKLKTGIVNKTGVEYTQETKDILVHHRRIVHYVTGNLTSEVFGVSKLKPIINRLEIN